MTSPTPGPSLSSKLQSDQANRPRSYHLCPAVLPVSSPSFQLKQVAFRITAGHLRLVSAASLCIQSGFALYPGQDGRECGAGQGALAGLHFRQLHQGLLVLFHDLGEPGVWRGIHAFHV